VKAGIMFPNAPWTISFYRETEFIVRLYEQDSLIV
jgi:hypothetical protein